MIFLSCARTKSCGSRPQSCGSSGDRILLRLKFWVTYGLAVSNEPSKDSMQCCYFEEKAKLADRQPKLQLHPSIYLSSLSSTRSSPSQSPGLEQALQVVLLLRPMIGWCFIPASAHRQRMQCNAVIYKKEQRLAETRSPRARITSRMDHPNDWVTSELGMPELSHPSVGSLQKLESLQDWVAQPCLQPKVLCPSVLFILNVLDSNEPFTKSRI